MHSGQSLGEYDIEARFHEIPAPAAAAPAPAVSTGLSIAENEKRILRQALVQARGNRTQAAKLLAVSRRTLHRRLAEFPELDT
jgi:DNA-binding NtrC family response regulator